MEYINISSETEISEKERLKNLTTDSPIYMKLLEARINRNGWRSNTPVFSSIASTQEDKEACLWRQIILLAHDNEFLISFIENKDEFIKIINYLSDCNKIYVTSMPVFKFNDKCFAVEEHKFDDYQQFIDYINQEIFSNIIVYSFNIEKSFLMFKLVSIKK